MGEKLTESEAGALALEDGRGRLAVVDLLFVCGIDYVGIVHGDDSIKTIFKKG